MSTTRHLFPCSRKSATAARNLSVSPSPTSDPLISMMAILPFNSVRALIDMRLLQLMMSAKILHPDANWVPVCRAKKGQEFTEYGGFLWMRQRRELQIARINLD